MNLMNFIIPLGIPLGITKFVAENEKENRSLINYAYATSFKLLLTLSLIASLFITIFSREISFYLLNDSKYFLIIIIVGVTIPINVLSFLADAYLKGLKLVNVFVKISILSSIVSLISIIPLTIYLDITGAIIGVILSSLYSFIIITRYLRKNNFIESVKLNKQFNLGSLKNIFYIGFASLITGAVLQLSILILRKITIDSFGISANGIYQSVYNISQNYFGFIFTSLAVYTLPKLAELKNNTEIIGEINSNLRIIIFIMIPLISVFYVFREFAIQILYTKDFIEAQYLLRFQFAGDFFKALSWILGLWLIARSKIFIWVVLDIIYCINTIVLYLIFLKFSNSGFTSISISYMISNFIHFVLNFFIISKSLEFKFTASNNVLISLSCLILILFMIVFNSSQMLSYIILIPTIFIWFFFSSNAKEKSALLSLIKKRVKR